MKVAYIIMSEISALALLAGAVLIPVYITPGYYWWSALFLLIFLVMGSSYADRLDKWEND